MGRVACLVRGAGKARACLVSFECAAQRGGYGSGSESAREVNMVYLLFISGRYVCVWFSRANGVF